MHAEDEGFKLHFMCNEGGDDFLLTIPVRGAMAAASYKQHLADVGFMGLPSTVLHGLSSTLKDLDADTEVKVLSLGKRSSERYVSIADCLRMIENMEAAFARNPHWEYVVGPVVDGIVDVKWSDSPATFPLFWERLRFITGGKLRKQVFEPAYNDLLSDHLTTQAVRFQTPWTRRWIKFCFGARTAWLVVECAAVGLRGTVGMFLLPQSVRDFVRNWWTGDRG